MLFAFLSFFAFWGWEGLPGPMDLRGCVSCVVWPVLCWCWCCGVGFGFGFVSAEIGLCWVSLGTLQDRTEGVCACLMVFGAWQVRCQGCGVWCLGLSLTVADNIVSNVARTS